MKIFDEKRNTFYCRHCASYKVTTSKTLIDTLSNFNLSAPYETVLRTEFLLPKGIIKI